MFAESLQSLTTGDTVVFEDAYTNETKYGRVERTYGGTFIVHIIPREKAGQNAKRLSVRQPCEIVLSPDGLRFCKAHLVELQESSPNGERNTPGLGQIHAWTCPISGKEFLEAPGL